jgi:trans-aconitate methyltransferase
MGAPVAGRKALEMGCGRGVGVELILDRFGAASVDAFDANPRMIALARRRLCGREAQVRLWIGDAADLSHMARESGDYRNVALARKSARLF